MPNILDLPVLSGHNFLESQTLIDCIQKELQDKVTHLYPDMSIKTILYYQDILGLPKITIHLEPLFYGDHTMTIEIASKDSNDDLIEIE